jgi:hypothetical protein
LVGVEVTVAALIPHSPRIGLGPRCAHPERRG